MAQARNPGDAPQSSVPRSRSKSFHHVFVRSLFGDLTPFLRALVERLGEAVDSAGGQDMQVLVVEDEAPIRMLVCDMLEAAGYMCIEAADAAEALVLLDIGLCRPDILVTDFNLGPGLNGQALAAEVSRKLPGLAVTFVTGNSEAFDDYRLRPWERLVAKPFSGPELVEAVSGLRPPHRIDPLGAASTRREPITDQSAEIRAEHV